MAATRTVTAATWNTTAGAKTATIAALSGDLLVAVTAHSGTTASHVVTDDSGGTWVQVVSGLAATSVDSIQVWVRATLVQSAVSTIVTTSPAASTGGGIIVYAISGMTRAGLAAIRSSGKQDNQAAATPAPVLGLTPLATSVIVTGIIDATNGSANQTVRAGYTEDADAGYNTPTTGFASQHLDGAESSATLTYGGAAPSAFGSVAVEVDGTDPSTPQPRPLLITVDHLTIPVPLLREQEPGGDIPQVVQADTINSRTKARATVGLELWVWLDAAQIGLADGSPITTWTDSSGHGRNATGGSPLLRTTGFNGKPTVAFDGISDELTVSATFPVGVPRTVYTVVQRLGADPAGPPDVWAFSSAAGLLDASSLGFHWQSPEAGGSTQIGTKDPKQAQLVVVRIADYGTLDAFTQGLGPVTINPDDSALSSGALAVGYRPGNSGHAQFRISEIRVYSGAHGDALRQSIETELFEKWFDDRPVPAAAMLPRPGFSRIGPPILRAQQAGGSAVVSADTISARSHVRASASPLVVVIHPSRAVDTFNRADSASLGSTELGAYPWSEWGTVGWKVASKQLAVEAAPPLSQMATIDLGTGSTDQEVSCLPISGAYPGVIARFTEFTADYGLAAIWPDGTTVQLFKMVAGVQTQIGSTGGFTSYGSGARTILRVVGDDVRVYVGATLAISYTIVEAALRTGTKVGVSGFQNAIVDDFAAVPARTTYGRNRSTAVVATTVDEQVQSISPARLVVPGLRTAGAGPPILRAQPPGIVFYTFLGASSAYDRARATAVGTDIVLASATTRNRARATSVGTDVVRGSASARNHARASVATLVVKLATATARTHNRATASTLVLDFGAASAREHVRSTAVAVSITPTADPPTQTPFLPRPGISRVAGPPILREQSADVTGLVLGAATGRDFARSTAASLVVEVSSAAARERAHATVSTILTSFVPPPVFAPLLTAGMGRRIGPPILREQEPGGTVQVAPVVDAGALSARSRGRSTSTGLASVRGAASARNHARSTAVATRIVFGVAQGRDHARATSVGRDIAQGSASARCHPRVMLPCLVINRGSASPRGRGRATSRGLAVVLGRAHAREHAYARAIGSTTFFLPTSVSVIAVANDAVRLSAVPDVGDANAWDEGFDLGFGMSDGTVPPGAIVGVGGTNLTIEAEADVTVALDAVADSGVDLPTPEEANAWDEGFDLGFGMSEESAFDVSFSDEEFG